MKVKLLFTYFQIILCFVFFNVQAQTEDEIVSAMYLGATDVVEQSDDLISYAVNAVWKASELTSTKTTVGTLTQSTTNPDNWTYSASPSDKLLLVFSNGTTMSFKFTTIDGYTEGTAEDFIASHNMDFTSEIPGVLNIRIQSQAGPNNGITEYTKIITGNSVYEQTPINVNITNSGSRNVTVDNGFAFGDYHSQTSGTISSTTINYTISESYTTYLGHDSNKGLFVKERYIHSNCSAGGNFGSLKFENLYCYYIGGTAFADSANAGIYNQAIEVYNWAANGQLLKDGSFFGNIQFNNPPIENTYGAMLLVRCQDGKDYLLDKLLMWFVTGVEEIEIHPSVFSLSQNYPNPFNPSTVISYQLPEFSNVTLRVYDVLGKEIATLVDKKQPIGSYKVNFDVLNLPSGVYLYRLSASGSSNNFVQIKKMVLLK